MKQWKTISQYYGKQWRTKTRKNYRQEKKKLSFQMESTPMTAMIAMPISISTMNGGSDDSIKSLHGTSGRDYERQQGQGRGGWRERGEGSGD
mmetsp:Transcript_18767/g.20671  ORF Transcript_18767/g.20671 Transcript_18767/m.20671 type:complete len:92 (-) Transcript_18767:229-504(-)